MTRPPVRVPAVSVPTAQQRLAMIANAQAARLVQVAIDNARIDTSVAALPVRRDLYRHRHVGAAVPSPTAERTAFLEGPEPLPPVTGAVWTEPDVIRAQDRE